MARLIGFVLLECIHESVSGHGSQLVRREAADVKGGRSMSARWLVAVLGICLLCGVASSASAECWRCANGGFSCIPTTDGSGWHVCIVQGATCYMHDLCDPNQIDQVHLLPPGKPTPVTIPFASMRSDD